MIDDEITNLKEYKLKLQKEEVLIIQIKSMYNKKGRA